ncbi:glycine betaine ABC transporter substrate-binding protein [Patulibacter sp.]|uniref:glycine betaine ABC transporter substrate-binding protein n=1 Tax=Patulibacter sp. TaxID=1912859 RepID=UPI00271E8250|nr:glycine betaine ABC transporter substrate-binding protein [Patulibacter sp.]MDO9407040.1 glycine betaine ABC transporter substrate-binding protein [Patulibacter sp.]
MNTRTLTTAAAAAVLALGVSACGSDSSDDSGSSSSSSGAGETIASQLIMGGPPEFKTRTDGLPGLKKNYGVEFGKYTVTDTGGPVTVNALKNGQIEAADLFTTDPSIAANDFVALEDPKNNFAAQDVLPIINEKKATDGVKTVLNGISAKLTTDGLGDLVSKVQVDKQDPDAVAKGWLSDNGLAGTGTSAKGTTLTVGSANFPENVVLAEIYAEALKAQGASITTKLNIGSREKYYPALKSGSLDLFPEYSGTILTYLDKNATATTPDDVYAALQKALPSNLVALEKSDAQDSDAIVVTKATADKYGLKTIADLAKPAN